MACELTSSRDLAIFKQEVYSSQEITRRKVKQITSKLSEDALRETISSDQYRFITRLFISSAVYLSVMVAGMNSASIGTTLVHMGCIYNANTQQMSLVLVFANLGYVFGALASGILFDRFSELHQMFVGCVLEGVFIIASPWVPNVHGYYVLVALSHGMQANVYSGAVVYSVRLWPTRKRPVFQAACAMLPIGMLLVPFIALPFLVDIPYTYEYTPVSYGYNNTENNTTSGVLNCDIDGLDRVRFIYTIIGSFMVAMGLVFLLLVIILRPSFTRTPVISGYAQQENRQNNEADEKEQKSPNKIKRIFQSIIMFLAVLFCLASSFYEYSFAFFLPTFAIKGLGMAVDKATLLLSLYYGTYLCGRILAIFGALVFSPTIAITINSSGTLSGYVILLLSDATSIAIWIAVALIGLSVSSTIPSLTLWISDYVVISGKSNALLLIAISVAAMLGASIGGFLLQNYNHRSLIYLALAGCVLDCFVFVLLVVTGRIYRKQKSV